MYNFITLMHNSNIKFSMDSGICSGNYFNYGSDDEARAGEQRRLEGLLGRYTDPDFPSDARAVYFDPYSTPKGQIPASQLKWFRISDSTLRYCLNPVVIIGDANSSNIDLGTLGDRYFVNALRMIGCRPALVNRLIVSSKFADRGIYTVKFFKMGKWRYVHIDDFIACRPSGTANFCRNKNPNETFAMILEKAYAKLHGCYEAISFGFTEQALQEFTYSGHIDCFRNEVNAKLMGVTAASDRLWAAITQIKEALYNPNDGELASKTDETGVIGCMRCIPDGFTEPPNMRRGIALGVMYEVIDACLAYAAPTETMDGLTVGMVLVRNFAVTTGRFVGRWGLGDILWKQYPEIAFNLRERTTKYLLQRGDVKRIKIKQKKPIDPKAKKKPPKAKKKKTSSMFDIPDDVSLGGSAKSDGDKSGPGESVDSADGGDNSEKKEKKRNGGGGEEDEEDPDEWEEVDAISDPYGESLLAQLKDGNRLDVDLYREADPKSLEEIDDPYSVFPVDMPSIKEPQPLARDLFWIQIEDFVEIFNRVFTVTDLSLRPNADCQLKTYVSKWIPGDFSVGSGGPPAINGGAGMDTSSTLAFEMLEKGNALEDLFLLRDRLNQDQAEEEGEEEEDNPWADKTEGGDALNQSADNATGEWGGENSEGAGGGTATGDGMTRTETVTDSSTKELSASYNLKAPNKKMQNFGEDSTYVASEKEYSMYDLLAPSKQKMAAVDNSSFRSINYVTNPSFSSNPMIPFELFYDTTLLVTLYQRDRRWGLDRFLNPVTTRAREVPLNRHDTLLNCLRYSTGIGFVIVRLFKSNTRISKWNVEKMVGKSVGIMYRPSISGSFDLPKGRYAVIPFQHDISNVAMDFMLSFLYEGYGKGEGICKIYYKDDIIAESQVDVIQSDSEGEGEGDGEKEAGGFMDDNSTIATKVKTNAANGIPDYLSFPPMPLIIPTWEYDEIVEEIGVKTLYEEIGQLAVTMGDIHHELRMFKEYLKQKKDELLDLKDEEIRKKAIADAKAAKKGRR